MFVTHERHPGIVPAFVVIALGLVPWTLYRAVTLPSRHVEQNFFNLTWAGLGVNRHVQANAATGFRLGAVRITRDEYETALTRSREARAT